MKRVPFLLLAALLACTGMSFAAGRFEPVYIYKVAPGNPFYPFSFPDLTGKVWSLKGMKGNPVLLLTAHRDVRYDVELWAKALLAEFGSRSDLPILWVVDLSRYPWITTERMAEKYWGDFKAPVPVILDWHAQVGRCLRIPYGTPNLIGIDSLGRLAFHESFPFSQDNLIQIKAQIKLLLKNVELPGRGYVDNTPDQIASPAVSGK